MVLKLGADFEKSEGLGSDVNQNLAYVVDAVMDRKSALRETNKASTLRFHNRAKLNKEIWASFRTARKMTRSFKQLKDI